MKGVRLKTVAARSVEKGYVRNAWMLLLVIGAFSILFGVATILASLQSSSSNSQLQVTQRDEGVVIVGFGLFGSAIAFKPFRAGERWAWYVALYVPAALVGLIVNSYTSAGANWPLFVVLLLLDLAALLLPYRKFFPRK